MAQDVKTFGALAIASVKTVEGLAIASAKTIMGVDNTSGGGACNTERMNTDGSFDGWTNMDFYTWVANRFTAPASFTNCKVFLRLYGAGTIGAGTLEAMIYTESGGNPGTLVGTGSATVSRLSVSGDAYVEFSSISAALTSATDYFLVFKSSVTDGGVGNGIIWVFTTGANTIRASTNGTSWDAAGTGVCNFKLNSV